MEEDSLPLAIPGGVIFKIDLQGARNSKSMMNLMMVGLARRFKEVLYLQNQFRKGTVYLHLRRKSIWLLLVMMTTLLRRLRMERGRRLISLVGMTILMSFKVQPERVWLALLRPFLNLLYSLHLLLFNLLLFGQLFLQHPQCQLPRYLDSASHLFQFNNLLDLLILKHPSEWA